MSARDEDRVSRVARALLGMAERANTARGASWEHGARSASTLTDAVSLIGELRAEVERLRARVAVERGEADRAKRDAAEYANRLDDERVKRGEALAEVERLTRERDALIGALLDLYHARSTTAERERDEARAAAAAMREVLESMVSTARGDASGVALQVERLDMLREIVDAATIGDHYQLADWIREHLLPHAERLGLGPVDAEEQGPHVCPGCHAVAPERCLPGCIDAEIEEERRNAEESGDYDSDDDVEHGP